MAKIYYKKGYRPQVLNAFYCNGAKTMLEVSKETGIDTGFIRWYVHDLKQSKRLYRLGQRKCTISGHLAGAYTTNQNRAVAYYNYATADYWVGKKDREISMIQTAVRAYVLNYFSQPFQVPRRIESLWENEIKPFINGRAGI